MYTKGNIVRPMEKRRGMIILFMFHIYIKYYVSILTG